MEAFLSAATFIMYIYLSYIYNNTWYIFLSIYFTVHTPLIQDLNNEFKSDHQFNIDEMITKILNNEIDHIQSLNDLVIWSIDLIISWYFYLIHSIIQIQLRKICPQAVQYTICDRPWLTQCKVAHCKLLLQIKIQ